MEDGGRLNDGEYSSLKKILPLLLSDIDILRFELYPPRALNPQPPRQSDRRLLPSVLPPETQLRRRDTLGTGFRPHTLLLGPFPSSATMDGKTHGIRWCWTASPGLRLGLVKRLRLSSSLRREGKKRERHKQRHREERQANSARIVHDAVQHCSHRTRSSTPATIIEHASEESVCWPVLSRFLPDSYDLFMSVAPLSSNVLSFEDARGLVEQHAALVQTGEGESVDLLQAAGRVLANPVLADRDIPPFPRSTRDGFAVRSVDVSKVPATLQVIGEIKAGQAPETIPSSLGDKQTVSIMTGAPVPRGRMRSSWWSTARCAAIKSKSREALKLEKILFPAEQKRRKEADSSAAV